MKINRVVIYALLSAIIFAEFNPVFASDYQSGFYAGIEAGGAYVQNETSAVASGLVNSLGGSASATQNSTVGVGRIFAGYKVIPNIDLEVGYFSSASDTVNFLGTTGGGTAYSGSIGVTAKGFDYSVLLRPNVATGINNLFLRLGGHSSKLDGTASINGSSASASISGSGYLVGLGYDGVISQNLDWRLGITSYQNLAGVSSASVTVYTIGILGKF
jgi:hypothetical protein